MAKSGRLGSSRARGDAIAQVGAGCWEALRSFVRASDGLRRNAACESQAEGSSRCIRSTLPKAAVLGLCLGAMWIVTAVNLLSGGAVAQVGIQPRNVPAGLIGVLAAPWVHLSVAHIAGNSLPFLGTGAMVMARGFRAWLVVTLWVVLVGGFALWLLGPTNTVHDGCSSLVLGWIGFLVAAALVECTPLSIVLGVLTFAVYGGCLLKVFPFEVRAHVSWQGHLCGLIAGVALVAIDVSLGLMIASQRCLCCNATRSSSSSSGGGGSGSGGWGLLLGPSAIALNPQIVLCCGLGSHERASLRSGAPPPSPPGGWWRRGKRLGGADNGRQAAYGAVPTTRSAGGGGVPSPRRADGAGESEERAPLLTSCTV